MAKQLLPEAEQYTKQNNLRQIWRKFVRVMACIVVFCTTYALILPAITMERDPVCGIEAHTHSDSCYTQVTTRQLETLSCTYESLGVHVHSAECYDAENSLVCGLSDFLLHEHDASCADESGAVVCTLEEISGHVHGESCYEAAEPELVCGLEEAEAHTHTDECHDAEGAVVCGLEESEGHTHGDACWLTPEPALICGRQEAILHTHADACYGADGALTCTQTVLEQHAHTDSCIAVTEVSVDTESLTCGQEESEEHAHTALCHGTWELTCSTAVHTHTVECYPAEEAETVSEETTPETGLTEAEQAEVDRVIQMIDEMPSADEIDARLAEFEEAEDYEGEEAYYTEVSQQVTYVYSHYSNLSDAQKAQVTNADKLLELEYIWSVTTLATYTTDPTIYQINSYEYSWSGGATMAHGGTVGTALGVSWEFVSWIGVIVEEDSSGNLYVEQIADSGTNKNSLKADTANGFVLLFYDDFAEKPIVSVGDLVTVDASIPDKGALKYNASTDTVSGGYGQVHFSSAISSITSAAPTPIKTASTAEFVELNLYDYNGYVNANYWAKNNWYPGFQWNGGAYSKTGTYGYRDDYTYSGIGIPYAVTDRNYIDSIDFGNSLITNLTYGYGGDGSYTKAVNATGVGYLDKTKTYPINWLYGNSTEGYTNKPIGYSTTDLTESQNVMKYSLVEGYPALTDGTMLNYLFIDGTPATKLNTQSIDGLFQHDPVTGAYYYNSRENHAQYENNKFTVYAQKITPNFITYPFGNFLPLNSISDSTKATQVGAFSHSGGVRDYVERIISDLENNTEGLYSDWESSQSQLITMLEEYKENWLLYPRTLNGTTSTWTNLSPGNAIRDYFLGDSSGNGDTPSSNTDFITQDFLNSLYNIDWDVQTNFFFGMEMKMNFYQPKDGLTGEDTNKDGTPDYPMEFYFTGDDDVWVYIDDVLFLDLSGIHRHVGGKIDFVNGKVYYYELLPSDEGDVKESAYKEFTFEQILTNAGASTSVLNSKGTFKNYTTHNFNFYYMERGSGSSVCRLNFNFPLLRQNTLSVEKELTADADIKALGNPDFQFQVLNVDDSGNKTNDSFFGKFDSAGAQWAYSLYDVDGKAIQEVKVTEKNPDGTVKTLEVYNAAGKIVRKETEDSTGNAVITNYPENGEVLTIDENGIFTLKAGQRAEFVGISENWGKYYVRELIDPAIVEQYGTITVDGQASSHVDNITVGSQTFTGYDSPIMDMSNGSTRFLFNNKITSAKLGNLTISKVLDAAYSGDTSKTFRFSVTLDGEPLPAGTTYTVGDTTKTVVVEDGVSYVELKGGETATISKILAGTKFEVAETAASAEGYVVSYTVDGTAMEAPAKGTIGLNQTVAVVVTNSERGTSVQIPVTKGYYKYGTVDRVSYFNLVQVTDATGMTTVGDVTSASITIKDAAVTTENLFTLNYVEKDVDFGESDTLVLYYRLTEDNTKLPGSTLPNYQVFVYEVTLTKSDSDMSAAITGMWSGTADKDGKPTGDLTKLDSVSTATFMNTIYGPLTVEKIVDGSDAYKQRKFEFEIILNTTHHGGAPLPDTLPAVITRTADDGTVTTEETTVALTPKPDSDTSNNGDTRKSINVTLSHNESITINQIPYNTTWSVTELNVPEDVEVSYEIYKGTELVKSEVDGKTVGYVKVGSANVAKVVVTNKQTYVLPETGGPGTTSYAMAGLMLMLCSAAFLLYRLKKRGREVV